MNIKKIDWIDVLLYAGAALAFGIVALLFFDEHRIKAECAQRGGTQIAGQCYVAESLRLLPSR